MNFFSVLLFIPSIMLGLIMGANDAGNILGPTVGNGILKMKRALYASSVFIIIGALLGGNPE